MFYCIVAGSRTFSDYSLLSQKLNTFLANQETITIISGGAKGADTLAKRYAIEHNLPYKEFLPNWNANGKSAGFLRNRQMHAFASQFENRGCVCFWDGKSRGTSHNFQLAKEFRTPIRVVRF